MKKGGANAPLNSLTKLWIRDKRRVSMAFLWPGGHSRGGTRLLFPDCLLSSAGFSV